MAVITANRSTDLTTIDLYDLVSGATAIDFLDNVNYTSPQGYHYQDILRISYTDILPTYASWGGSGFTFNNNEEVTGGTVTGFINQVFSGGSYRQAYAVEGFAYSAVAIYNAAMTFSTADDMAAFASVLSGNDTFNLSAEADRVDGFAGNDTIRGNGAGDALYGGSGNDLLDGGSGGDLLVGGPGNDTYIVDSGSDVVSESAGGGIDTVRSGVARVLGANQENLVLTGSASINGTGNSAANEITGNAGANVLNGGGGADRLAGGAGNDTYVIGNTGVVVVELAGGGVDTVRSSVSRTLGSSQENLVLTGGASINGAGNSAANEITGNAGANVLNGGGGADRLAGGAGNDTYVIGNTGVVVVELAGGGVDTVRSSVSRTLGSFQENLVLTGSGSISGTGNDAANVITGNAAANVLDGGGGADRLIGGAGSDTYVIGNTGVVVVELAGGGIDTVRSSINRTLGSSQENLVLTGGASINGTGNDAANVITGNAGANTLDGDRGADRLSGAGGNDSLEGEVGNDTVLGGSGNDTVLGGSGNDLLAGGTGLDAFRFDSPLNATNNVDRVIDFISADDRFQLDDAVFAGIGPAGMLAASALRLGPQALDASDRIIYNSATGWLSFDADGNGSGAAIHFATLDIGTTVTLSDFVIV